MLDYGRLVWWWLVNVKGLKNPGGGWSGFHRQRIEEGSPVASMASNHRQWLVWVPIEILMKNDISWVEVKKERIRCDVESVRIRDPTFRCRASINAKLND